MDPAQRLRDFKPAKDFFVGIDSDGCVFDSMEIKHKECFAPMFIKHFRLQAVSKYAREVWEFVNLYSKARGVKMPDIAGLDEWVQRETKLGNATLNAEVNGGNKSLEHIKVWSDAVN